MKQPHVLLFILITLSLACSGNQPKETQEENILAEVGNNLITVEEFRLNYEFGFSTLKTGENSEEKYLELMITELLLAREGYERGIHQRESIQQAVAEISKERLIEEVFKTNVLDHISVSEEEIRNEINKAAVSFQLKFLPAQSEPHALFLKQEAEEKGYRTVLAEYSNELMAGPVSENDFLFPYMKADEIAPALLAEVQDLEIQKISDPVFYNGQWFLMMVNDIKRQPVASEDYMTKSETYRKVLYNRKAMQGAETYVKELMEPLNVSTKRPAFDLLASAFYEWLSAEHPAGNLVEKAEKGERVYHHSIRRIFSEPLVAVGGETWTVKKFLLEFSPGRYQLRPESEENFKIQFADAIALTVRDVELLKIAEEENLRADPSVQHDIRKWENKWVFQEMRKEILEQIPFSDTEVAAFYHTNREDISYVSSSGSEYEKLPIQVKKRVRRQYLSSRLRQFADSLKEVYPVAIDQEKLASLRMHHSSSTSPVHVQLLRQNSNRMAFPVVDPNW